MNASRYLMIGIAAAGAASAAAAQEIDVVGSVPSIAVSFADLNIGSAAGRDVLDARLRGAARRLCHTSSAVPVEEHMERRSCYADALGNARRQAALAAAEHGRTRLAGKITVTVAAR